MNVERINVNYLDWPRCCECLMVVEDFFILNVYGETELVAYCHNQLERVVIDFELWDNALLPSALATSAFQN